MWGLRPHAPGGLAAPPRPRGRKRVVYGGRSPPRPHPGRARLRAALARPPALGVSFCGGCAPTPPAGWQRPRGREAESVLSMGGCAPHAPIPDEHALRRGSGPPTHPRIVLPCGGCAPTPPTGWQRPRGPEGAPGARDSHRAEGLRGASRYCEGASDWRGRWGVWGAQPPTWKNNPGVGGWARAALRGVPASTEARRACSSESLASNRLRGALETSELCPVSPRAGRGRRRRRGSRCRAPPPRARASPPRPPRRRGRSRGGAAGRAARRGGALPRR